MKENKTIHFTGIDIVRIVATILVLTVHFFLNTYFYQTKISGINLNIQVVIRNFCMSCVPLFLLLTGYLGNKKEYNSYFFKRLLEILIIWLFYSCIEFFVINALNNSWYELNFKNLLFSITNFQACHYSWYIEMYIGLYLLSPIINIAYDSFDNKNKNIFVFISVFLTFLPIFINNILNGIFLIPDYWIILYPFSYYIVGKYINDKKFCFKKKNLLVLLIFTQLLTFSFSNIMTIEYNSPSIFIQSVLLFLLLYDIKININWISKTLNYLSSISLDIYLASSLIDQIIYPLFLEYFKITNQENLILFSPAVVCSVFIISAIYGSIRKFLIKLR